MAYKLEALLLSSTPVILDAYGRAIETRASGNPTLDWLNDMFGAGGKTTSNERVSARSAMTVMAFFACVRNISEDLAKLPKKVRQKQGREHTDLPAHPVSRLLRRPNPEMNAHSFCETIIAHACAHHGGFAEIVYDASGRPVELWPLDPCTVTQVRSRTGELVYRVQYSGVTAYIPQRNMLHVHGLGYDGISGYSMPDLGRELIGTAIALQKFTGSYFGKGATPSGVLTHPQTLTEGAVERLRKQFIERYSGAANSHTPMLLEEGTSWTPISNTAEDAQATELTGVTVADICRMFRMPPHKIQHLANATFSNIEHQGIEYGTDTIDPWRSRFKDELEFKLLSPDELDQGVYVDINLKGLMRADTAQRTAFYKELYYMGAYSANDILELEDENPVEGGDRRFVQANLVPVDKVDQMYAAKDPAAPPAQDPTPPAQPAQANSPVRIREAFVPVLASKLGSILTVENSKAIKGKCTNEYYDKLRDHVRDELIAIVGAAITSLNCEYDPEIVSEWYARYHCERSQSDISVNQLDSWRDGTRAHGAASIIMEKLCNTAA